MLPSSAAAGAWNVVVTGPDGQSASLRDGFTVYAPLTVASIAPNAGNAGETVSTTVTGTGFLSGATAKLSRKGEEIAATSVVVVSPTTITCSFAVPPTAAAGTWSVVVADPDRRTATLSNGFTVVAPLTITSIAPEIGSQGTEVAATINGTGFLTGATARLTRDREQPIAATSVVVVSATQITCTFALPPTAALGAWNVVVANPGGASGTRSGGFTITSTALAVTSITPNTGFKGIKVPATNLTGYGFQAGATVRLHPGRQPC